MGATAPSLWQVHRKGHQLPDFSVRRKKISRMNSRRLAERILFGPAGGGLLAVLLAWGLNIHTE